MLLNSLCKCFQCWARDKFIVLRQAANCNEFHKTHYATNCMPTNVQHHVWQCQNQCINVVQQFNNTMPQVVTYGYGIYCSCCNKILLWKNCHQVKLLFIVVTFFPNISFLSFKFYTYWIGLQFISSSYDHNWAQLTNNLASVAKVITIDKNLWKVRNCEGWRGIMRDVEGWSGIMRDDEDDEGCWGMIWNGDGWCGIVRHSEGLWGMVNMFEGW